ncbi:MAG TPA: GNAT family N-acetyltransferase [Anaerolineales bacterium]|nr:GNAT family N-acetyltransferase [Anaerolineales bacterium]
MSKMLQLIQVTSDEQITHVYQLFREYVQLLHETANQEYGISIDVDSILNMFMKGIDDFYPPRGRIYLAKYNFEIAGVGCLKQLEDDVGEIKRMFVRSEYRRKGIGKEVLDRLITDARAIGYTKIRLDSPKAFSPSHALYQSRGFQYIEPYPGSEGAAQADLFVFMEFVL